MQLYGNLVIPVAQLKTLRSLLWYVHRASESFLTSMILLRHGQWLNRPFFFWWILDCLSSLVCKLHRIKSCKLCHDVGGAGFFVCFSFGQLLSQVTEVFHGIKDWLFFGTLMFFLSFSLGLDGHEVVHSFSLTFLILFEWMITDVNGQVWHGIPIEPCLHPLFSGMCLIFYQLLEAISCRTPIDTCPRLFWTMNKWQIQMFIDFLLKLSRTCGGNFMYL